nr:GNAT family N-acetyltransferase [Enterococcus sp. CU12B]
MIRLNIREITAQDDLQMAQIIRHILENHQLDIPGTAYFDPQLDHLSEFYRDLPDSAYWVLVNENEQVVGGVGIAPLQDNIAELQKLYLSDAATGHGYGQQLLSHAINFAQQHYQQLYLETSSILKAANGLYHKNGFKLLDKPLGETGHTLMDTWFLKQLHE